MNRLKLALASLCFLTSSAAVAQPTTDAPTVLRVAVNDVETSAVDEKIGRLVTEAILAETRKLEGVEVIGMAELRAMMDLEAQKQLAGCEQESCLAEIAEALGVDVLIVGSIATLNTESFMSVKRIDQLAAKTVGTYNQRMTEAGGEEFLAVIGDAVQTLFPKLPLREGQERGVSDEIYVRLKPPPIPLWATVSTAGVGAAVAAVALVSFGAFAGSQVLYDSVVQSGTQEQPVAGKDLQGPTALVWTTYGVALAATAISVATLGGAGLMALFTDFRDVEETE